MLNNKFKKARIDKKRKKKLNILLYIFFSIQKINMKIFADFFENLFAFKGILELRKYCSNTNNKNLNICAPKLQYRI